MGGVRENADFADQLRGGMGVMGKNADLIFECELDETYASMSYTKIKILTP